MSDQENYTKAQQRIIGSNVINISSCEKPDFYVHLAFKMLGDIKGKGNFTIKDSIKSDNEGKTINTNSKYQIHKQVVLAGLGEDTKTVVKVAGELVNSNLIEISNIQTDLRRIGSKGANPLSVPYIVIVCTKRDKEN
ncbi:hypothetical protein cand_011970 [Cryptosporidium andersoni]|uniref:Uncharacterized protein n=1 Tax=Cryptosporidium andersoni TaxID=117008 RepID=A0A1J4MII8_9CRYT|nr:hypothetical protein cand_011970 [Cryptosporidium andersoni]